MAAKAGTRGRIPSMLLVVSLTLVASLGFVVRADAAPTHLFSIGSKGSAPGEFEGPG